MIKDFILFFCEFHFGTLNVKKIIVNSGFFICIISFLLYILATIFNCFLVDSNEYLSVANHLNLSDKLNINKEDLTYTINQIFDYVYGKSDNMNLTIKIEDRSV